MKLKKVKLLLLVVTPFLKIKIWGGYMFLKKYF